MWITMLLSGLWHGAAITFVLWGAFHAAALTLERILNRIIPKLDGKIFMITRWASTYLLVLLGWVFFRATTWDQIVEIIQEMATLKTNWDFVTSQMNPLIYLATAILFEGGYLLFRKHTLKNTNRAVILDSVILAFMVAMIIFFRGPEKEFIYFQF